MIFNVLHKPTKSKSKNHLSIDGNFDCLCLRKNVQNTGGSVKVINRKWYMQGLNNEYSVEITPYELRDNFCRYCVATANSIEGKKSRISRNRSGICSKNHALSLYNNINNTNVIEMTNVPQFAVTYLHNYSVHTHGTWIHCYNWMKKFGIHRFRIRELTLKNIRGKQYFATDMTRTEPVALFLEDPDPSNDGEDSGYNFTNVPGC